VRPDRSARRRAARTHGSALFTAARRQRWSPWTLGTGRDEQIIDALTGEYRERFMLHYNMAAYATGETGRVGPPQPPARSRSPWRLAKRRLGVGLLPTQEDFGYSIRVFPRSPIQRLFIDGLSLRGSLALMDAGVPVKAHVAGIAMGLIKEATASRCCPTSWATRITSATWTSRRGHRARVTALQWT